MDVTEAIKRLWNQRQDLEEEIKSLQERQAQIDTTIAVLQSLETGAGVDEQLLQTDQRSERRTIHDVEPPPSTRGRGPQAVLRRLLHDRPGQEFDSKAAYNLLVDDGGWKSAAQDPVNVVRSALAQLYSAGELVRRGRGKYVYDPDQQEPTTMGKPDDPQATGVEPDMTVPSYGTGSYTAGAQVKPVEDRDIDDRRTHDPYAPRPSS